MRSVGAPVGEKTSSKVVESKETYGQSQDSKFQEHCKNDNCKFKVDKDGSVQKDKDVDVTIHSRKRDQGYDFERHDQKKEDIDFTGSVWDDSKSKADVDYHAQKWDDKDEKVSGVESDGKKKITSEFDGKHDSESHLDLHKSSQHVSRSPLLSSIRQRIRAVRHKIGVGLNRLGTKYSKHHPYRRDVKYHENESSFDTEHAVAEGYKNGKQPPKGSTPDSKAVDAHVDRQHYDEKHIELDAEKYVPAKAASIRRDVTTVTDVKADEKNYTEDHVQVKAQEDLYGKTKDVNIDRNGERWGEKNVFFEDKVFKDGI